jgi:hypothetical protein
MVMHKLIPFFIFLSLPLKAFSAEVELQALGDQIPFIKPLQVNVTVVEKVRGMVYWAEPLLDEPKGIKNVKDYIETTKTNNYMASPFVFQFRIAGVHKEDESGEDLNNDNYAKETNKKIDATFEGKPFTLSCYGYFSSTIVPYCDLIDADNQSPVVDLISQGLVIPDDRYGMVDESLSAAFAEALKNAKNDQVGMWKPYHSMFRGLN